jgi:hypothetical protein
MTLGARIALSTAFSKRALLTYYGLAQELCSASIAPCLETSAITNRAEFWSRWLTTVSSAVSARLSGPNSLPTKAVTLYPSFSRYPVAQTQAGTSEVAVPVEWCRALLVGAQA